MKKIFSALMLGLMLTPNLGALSLPSLNLARKVGRIERCKQIARQMNMLSILRDDAELAADWGNYYYYQSLIESLVKQFNEAGCFDKENFDHLF